MQNVTWVWISYISAAVLTLLSKLVRYVYYGRRERKKTGRLVFEWFLERSKENAASWVTTVGFVWVFGYLFIEHAGTAEGIFGSVFKYLPVACPVGFLLGSAAEMAAPNFAKWLVGKLSSGS